ncbi:uncharacterized protein LOC128982766 [Macrosteles quadrilineatus]|uniref:uncharacterized protein LOC128982766 n=1 Tax=Macrosteles quadrilineatus TaxID=74068 RepID=UPI0023E1107E|nr:uncharacterized protein LOC128982766 [Macrosteles quadrilineatus]
MGGMRWILGTGVIVIVIQELRFWIQLRNWPIKWARLKTHQENYWNLHKNWTTLNLNGYLLHQMRQNYHSHHTRSKEQLDIPHHRLAITGDGCTLLQKALKGILIIGLCTL